MLCSFSPAHLIYLPHKWENEGTVLGLWNCFYRSSPPQRRNGIKNIWCKSFLRAPKYCIKVVIIHIIKSSWFAIFVSFEGAGWLKYVYKAKMFADRLKIVRTAKMMDGWVALPKLRQPFYCIYMLQRSRTRASSWWSSLCLNNSFWSKITFAEVDCLKRSKSSQQFSNFEYTFSYFHLDFLNFRYKSHEFLYQKQERKKRFSSFLLISTMGIAFIFHFKLFKWDRILWNRSKQTL